MADPGATQDALTAVAVGIAGLLAAIGGILLALRALVSNARKAVAEEIAQLQDLLHAERRARIAAEVRAHGYAVRLAQHGDDPDDL